MLSSLLLLLFEMILTTLKMGQWKNFQHNVHFVHDIMVIRLEMLSSICKKLIFVLPVHRDFFSS